MVPTRVFYSFHKGVAKNNLIQFNLKQYYKYGPIGFCKKKFSGLAINAIVGKKVVYVTLGHKGIYCCWLWRGVAKVLIYGKMND